MDPVSHLIFGRALAALAPPPAAPAATRGLTAAIVIGSIAPDVDAVLMPTGWDRYLLWHERGTHALAGTAIDAAVLAGLLWLALRAIDRRRARASAAQASGAQAGSASVDGTSVDGAQASGARTGIMPASAAHAGRQSLDRLPRYRHLWLAAWLGCLGHITLDLVSGGTIRLFAPLSTQPFGLPLTAMADPLIALPLIGFLLAALVWKRRVRALAVTVMCLLAGLLVVKAISVRAARGVYRARVAAATAANPNGATPDARAGATLQAVEARWGTFTSWMFYDRTSDRLRGWVVDARTGAATLAVERRLVPPRTSSTPAAAASRDAALIAASRELDTVRHLFSLYDLTFVETRARGDEVDVLWSDIRFCGPADCALWFGGTFTADDRPREQFVLIGGLRQARPR